MLYVLWMDMLDTQSYTYGGKRFLYDVKRKISITRLHTLTHTLYNYIGSYTHTFRHTQWLKTCKTYYGFNQVISIKNILHTLVLYRQKPPQLFLCVLCVYTTGIISCFSIFFFFYASNGRLSESKLSNQTRPFYNIA